MPVETFADAAGFVRGLTGDRPFDIAFEGATEPGTAAGHIAPYAAAGATWWVEAMGWSRGDLATARDRITAGPPAGGGHIRGGGSRLRRPESAKPVSD